MLLQLMFVTGAAAFHAMADPSVRALGRLGACPLRCRSRAMRSRTLLGCSDRNEEDLPLLRRIEVSLFGSNINTPEALKKQREWAREQMASEVPETTADGQEIRDREDFIAKYIISEKEKFGRELTYEEAALEVDTWLLKQATNAPAKTSSADVGIAIAVFVAAFGVGLYFANNAPQISS